MEGFEKALQRINNIDWNIRKENLPSQVFLVTEFINRGNIFRDAYAPDNHIRKPIYSAAKVVGVEEETLVKVHKKVEELELLKHGWPVEFLCKFFLEWVWINSIQAKRDIRFDDLYEPIILLFERGGRISYHHNEMVCGKYGWPLNVYLFPRKKINEIKICDLDEMDKKL